MTSASKEQCAPFGPVSIEMTDEDIMTAMKGIQGYIDITPGDFKEIYQVAFRHAFERLTQSVTAGDIMTRAVVSVHPDTDLIEAARRMEANGISGMPVVSEAQVVMGVISEKDFLRKMGADNTESFMGVVAECLSNKGCLAMPIRGKSARDIMTAPAITAGPDASMSELSGILTDHHINRIPVVDGRGKLLGIVSRGDLVGSFCAKID